MSRALLVHLEIDQLGEDYQFNILYAMRWSLYAGMAPHLKRYEHNIT